MKTGNKKIKIDSLIDTDFQYIVDTAYDLDSSNCTCDGYCRCGKIVNARIKSQTVDIPSIVNKIVSVKTLDEIFKYCLERILVALKIYDCNNWDINICNGYYGQEIKSVRLNRDIAETCDNWIKKLIETTDNNDRIRLVLEAEYGYILEGLKYANFTLKEIDKSDIHFGQETYRKKVSLGDQEIYKNYTGICGICNCDNATYRLIDGYHRCCSVTTNKIKVLVF